MVKQVLQKTSDTVEHVFEFEVIDAHANHVIRVASSDEMTEWICIIQEACGLNGVRSSSALARNTTSVQLLLQATATK